jgi:peptidyl-prolyl cis-trans isomerase D
MLRFLRKYSSSFGIKFLYAVLAGLFILWGVGAIGGERRQDVAVVHGQAISRRDLEQATAALTRQYEQMLRGSRSAELLRNLNLSGQALDQLIEQALLRHEAARLGIVVTDADLLDAVTRLPELQQNGRFDRSRLEAIVHGGQGAEFEDAVRQNLLRQRLQALVTDGVGVSDGELEERYRFDHEKANLAFVRSAAAELAATITLSDEELQKYLDGHPDPYRVPARVRARYVAYRPADFLSQVEVKDDEVAEYYALHKDDKFTEPEQVRARHILVKTAADAGADAKAAARKKAEELLAKVKAGADFAALAKERSEDAGSAANGGDLGLFTRGRMTPAFEEAAFALQAGGVSDVVETPFGFHVIKVEEHRPGGVKPLETVHDEIVDTLKRERSLALARKQAEEDRRKIARGAPFAEALAGRTIEETPPFAKGAEVPGVGRVPGFAESAFALREGEVSDLIESPDAIYLLSPFAYSEAHTPPLDEVRERVAADARRERGEAAARERADKLLARAREIGLDQAAAEAGVRVEETGPFERVDSIPKIGRVADLTADAFTLAPEAPLAPKVYATGGDAIVVALRARTPADMAGFEGAKDGLRETLLKQKREAVLTAYLSYLMKRAQSEGALEVRADARPRG